MSMWTAFVIICALSLIYCLLSDWMKQKKQKRDTHTTSKTDVYNKRTIEDLEKRLQTIETILDDEIPDWRKQMKNKNT